MTLISFLLLISVLIGHSQCNTKTQKFVKLQVTDVTLLKSKVRSSSSVGCGSWCMNTENCLAFKLDGKNCILYSDYNPYLVGKDPGSFLKIMVPFKHPKSTWIQYTKLESSEYLKGFDLNQNLCSSNSFQVKHLSLEVTIQVPMLERSLICQAENYANHSKKLISVNFTLLLLELLTNLI